MPCCSIRNGLADSIMRKRKRHGAYCSVSFHFISFCITFFKYHAALLHFPAHHIVGKSMKRGIKAAVGYPLIDI